MPDTRSLSPSYVYTISPPMNGRIGDRYLLWLGGILLGYAIGGRGFAYLGYPPLYIGEITLAFGLTALCFSRSLPAVMLMTQSRLLIAVMIWGAIRTLPYLHTYGINALRDGAFYGYGLFAFIAAAILIDRPERLRVLLLRYRRFAVLFLSIIWALFLAKRMGYVSFPRVMGSRVEIIEMLGGPLLVHVAGATAFILVGMARPSMVYYLLISLDFFVIGLVKRSGMLAFLAAMGVLFLFKHPKINVRHLVSGACIVLVIIAVASPFSGFMTKSRTISIEQLWINFASIASNEAVEGSNVIVTKEWRLSWWSKIIGYTFGGDYFWTGKGFGINLAEDDGFLLMKSVREGSPTRSPHNSHLTMLARAGVPGFVLWLALQLSWAGSIAAAIVRSRRARDYAWSSVFIFLLSYWMAFVTEASFNVSLEGPQEAIWFWTLFGAGLAALHIYARHPEIVRP